MKCMLCGTENRDEATRCKGCGAALSGSLGTNLGQKPAPTVLEAGSAGVKSPFGGAPQNAPPAQPAPSLGQAQQAPAPAGAVKFGTRVVSPNEMAQAAQAAQVPLAGSAAAPAAQPPAGGGGNPSRTMYIPPDAVNAEGHRAPAVAQGKLVGFLVCFTWDSCGQWFPVREGKTSVGSGPKCDVSMPSDRAMSAQHFAVMWRNNEVRVRDLDSTNATRIDGQEVWGDSIQAVHGSVIGAGDSVFQLVLIPELPK